MQNDLLNDTQQAIQDEQQPQIDWERVQAWVQTGIMFLMGLYFIDLAMPGGNLANYVNISDFAWLTWVGAAILLMIAGMNAVDLLRDKDIEDPHKLMDPNYGIGKPGSVWSWVFLGVVAVPLVLGLGVPSKPLGADAITDDLSVDIRSVGFGSEATLEISSQPNNILDWVRAFASAPDLTDYQGEEISVLGFVYRDARFQGTDDFMLVRFTMSCCVADSRPVGLVVQTPNGANLTQDTWLDVSGTVDIQMIDGIETPVIIANDVQPTEAPEQPYLYF